MLQAMHLRGGCQTMLIHFLLRASLEMVHLRGEKMTKMAIICLRSEII